ncbi:uncharacterized protein SPAPADRAFT_139413 [Spathaspora passalidarum NRRL Y-27907]|uniref:Uncharacterized protein n=1 Tax=Spathaspora passalidarum (strain NRRL Y-27907 / 11-Y1) TaxID=619300 RepID=G3APS7_SPAPN|nr:uncharacterized protein SPAPADRAFT_139413 [Spathaspora passalidarum NRRL Y-27907]EGW32248.1 hypothetical protein SPAPADRAFT_139413 [Spathaspora passalidarum NRRL Y-27907]
MEETDYSSDYESFFSLREDHRAKSKISTAKSPQNKNSLLIQHAARLELESITLKESISNAIRTIKEVPVSEILDIHAKVNHIKKEVGELNVSYKIDQKTMKNANQELITIKKELTELSQKLSKISQATEISSNTSSSYFKQFHDFRLKTEDKFDKIIQTNRELAKLNKTSTRDIPDTSSHQLKEMHKLMLNQSEGHTRELQEIKQFLTLVLPRIINLENSVQLLVNDQSQESHSYNYNINAPSVTPANSRKTSRTKNAITKKRRLI